MERFGDPVVINGEARGRLVEDATFEGPDFTFGVPDRPGKNVVSMFMRRTDGGATEVKLAWAISESRYRNARTAN